MNTNDLIIRIKTQLPILSKRQKLIANYILNHYDKAVFLTAAKLGAVVGVSESTVVRFANEIGYDGYPQFQDALEELVKSKLTAMQRLEVTTNRIDKTDVLKTVLQADEEKIRYTLEEIDKQVFSKVIEEILNAKTIYILGVRSCAGIATFLNFYLNIMFGNIKLITTNSISEIFEEVHRITKDDILIAISFPRYSKRAYKAIEFVKARNAKILAITDSKLSPIGQCADYVLVGRSEMVSFVDSLVAPLSIINAIIVALSLKKKDELVLNLENLENVWMEYEVYEDTRDEVSSKDNKEKCD
ncbi:N-acetylmannosamine kinase [Candidatus Epulonipiscium fishelsonii]|uniref:N-acetylmannosamine kinase n=1 Tax=Candidatus Epulonipiscium fishelsonii TaxID=77094 RepID=A0ACC8XAM9_9FIRM|nr:N-acetylmannosamine kinase [Epulopiscium sp. SCG-B05WGA-EpuloA1]ONI39486.1 N-acetylmannosamine kinase [Epulopiscium sp. SCG-B11WGA-EpuloA1]